VKYRPGNLLCYIDPWGLSRSIHLILATGTISGGVYHDCYVTLSEGMVQYMHCHFIDANNIDEQGHQYNDVGWTVLA